MRNDFLAHGKIRSITVHIGFKYHHASVSSPPVEFHADAFDWRGQQCLSTFSFNDGTESASTEPRKRHGSKTGFFTGFDPSKKGKSEVNKTRSNPHSPLLKQQSHRPHALPLGFLNRGLDVG
jgi:hypothetical protein